MKILLDYSNGVTLCRIAQEGNFLFALTACCNVEFNVVPDNMMVYTCSSCGDVEDAYTWSSDSNKPLPTSIVLTENTITDYHDQIIEWISTWTGIPQDELSIEVSWS